MFAPLFIGDDHFNFGMVWFKTDLRIFRVARSHKQPD